MKSSLLTIASWIAFSSLAIADSASEEEEKQIRGLIEDLVLVHEKASDTPLIAPGIAGNNDKEFKRQFEKCRRAFTKLTEFQEKAFPFLVEHLKDVRPSIHFRNHYLGHTVGDACYWNIYFQLQDRPENYSSYGYQRKGRDGKDHPKPYWQGTLFDDAGGVDEWLEANKNLSYAEMQVKCLTWLLEREKKIGAADAESYFENILPLEIRILERKLETGVDVKMELERLRGVQKRKDVMAVPKELLPDKAEAVADGQPAVHAESK